MSEAGSSVRTGTVAARMDALPITRTHRLATFAVGLGLFFEFYEVFMTGVLSSVLVEEFHLTKAQLPPLLASVFLGMFLGSLLLGRMADRFGRRGAFLLNLSLYAFFSLLAAFSPGPAMLLLTRFGAGIGLGAEPPLADVYLTDLMPAKRRGRYIAWAYTLAFLGVPAVGFLAHGLAEQHLGPLPGWRLLFVIGAVGGFAVLLLRRSLPESPRWLEAVGRHEEAARVVARFEAEAEAAVPGGVPAATPSPSSTGTPTGSAPGTPAGAAAAPRATLRDLVGPAYRRRTVMMTLFHLLQTFGYYGFGTLVPLVLAAKGFAVSDSLLFTALTFLGYPIGSALSLPLVERFERKVLVVASLVAMVLFGLAFGSSTAIAPILVLGFLYTVSSNVFSNAFHIYQAEIFPTEIRSTAASGTYALSRLSTGAMPFVLVPVLAAAGPAGMFAVVAVAMAVVAVDVAVLGPRTTGRRVEAVAAVTGEPTAPAAPAR